MGFFMGVLNSSEGTLSRLKYDFIYDINIITRNGCNNQIQTIMNFHFRLYYTMLSNTFESYRKCLR